MFNSLCYYKRSISPNGDRMNAERRALWTLAWPVILTNGAMMSLGVVDMIMVGRLGPTAIASLSVSVTWMYATAVFGRNIPAGVEPLVSQVAGEKQTETRARLFQHLLRVMVLALIPQVCLYLSAERGLLLFGQQPEVASLAGAYCSVLALAVPAELAFVYAMRFFQAMEKVQSATISVVAANLLNVLANYIFIYQFDLGVLGSAWASCLSTYGMCFILLWRLRADIGMFCKKYYRYSSAIIHRIWKLGWPTGLQFSLEVWGFVLSVLFAGWIGTESQAAHAIVLNIASVCFMVPLGLSVAAATRVGKMIGIGGDWKNAIWQAILTMLLVEGVLILLLVVGAGWWPRIYTDDPALMEVVVPLVYLCACFQVFDGSQVVGLGILRGMGDVRLPLFFHLVAYWMIGMPLALLLAFQMGFGVRGIWLGLATALAIVSILCGLRIAYWMRTGVQSLYASETE